MNLRSLEEVRQRYEEGPHSHEKTADCNEPWTMELGAKVADKGDHQQVAWKREKYKKE